MSIGTENGKLSPYQDEIPPLKTGKNILSEYGGKACYHCFHNIYSSLVHSEHWRVLFRDKESCQYSSFIAIMYVGCNLKESNSVLSK